MAVTLTIDGEAWRKRNERLEKLKEKQFPSHGKIEKMMYPELYSSATKDNVDTFIDDLGNVLSEKQLSLSSIFQQVTPSGNSLLHLVASYGKNDINQLVVHHFPHLVTKTNCEGDTALHLAARAGKLNTTETLVNYAKNNTGQLSVAGLLRIRNGKGNTALHDAVISHHTSIIKVLVSADPELLYYENKKGESPLYLAVRMKSEKMLPSLLDVIKDGDPYSRLEGKSPLHAAIEQKNTVLLGMMGRSMPQLIQVSDDAWGTPLQYASFIGFSDGVCFLLETFSDGAFKRNQDGLHPIHVACQKGHVSVLKEFAKKWSYPMEFLTKKGQNILHVAAENGHDNVVKYILQNLVDDERVLNKRDDDGNTPLHLAAKQGHSLVVFSLVRDKRVSKLVANDENLTSYQIAQKQSKIALAEYEKSDIKDNPANPNRLPTMEDSSGLKEDNPANPNEQPTMEDLSGLKQGNPANPNEQPTMEDSSGLKQHSPANPNKQPTMEDSSGLKQLHNYYGVTMTLAILYFMAAPKMPPAEHFRIQGTPTRKKEIKSRMENLLVVAVLVAGVTFAGSIQLPQLRGNESDENSTSSQNSNCGTGTNNGGVLLDVYIYLDMWAFSTSVVAAIIICWTQLNIINFAPSAVWIASRMIGSSIYTMCMAFLFAVLIALRDEYGFLTTIIAVLGGVFLLAQTILCLQWFLPPIVNQIFEGIISQCIYFLAFLVYFCYNWLVHKIIRDRK